MAAHNTLTSSIPSFWSDGHTSKGASPCSMQHDSRTPSELSPNSENELSPNSENRVCKHAEHLDGVLHVTIHHAQDIHNICIYGNQDVYAKFSLSHCQDIVYSTQPVKAGGRNPIFNQSLQIPICQADTVLKCEIWMMSCAQNYLQDQLLGFVTVPLKDMYSKGKLVEDFPLSSTDLFYTPAGTVRMALLFSSRDGEVNDCEEFQGANPAVCQSPNSPIVMMMDCGGSGQESLAQVDLNKVEFPDLEAALENQHLVSIYLNMAERNAGGYSESTGVGSVFEGTGDRFDHGIVTENQEQSGKPFLQLGFSSSVGDVDSEMSLVPGNMEVSAAARDDSHTSPHSIAGLSYAEVSVSKDDSRILGGSLLSRDVPHKEVPISAKTSTANLATDCNAMSGQTLSCSPPSGHSLFKETQSVTSPSMVECVGDGQSPTAVSENQDKASDASAFITPFVNISIETETPAVNQEQIVDMYMKSIQQFTEKLAEMNFSLDKEVQEAAPSRSMKVDKEIPDGKKQNSKLYYGSRAFF